MRRFVCLSQFVAMVVGVAVAPAQREGTDRVPPTLMIFAAHYLRSESLQKELKLTAEQVKKVAKFTGRFRIRPARRMFPPTRDEMDQTATKGIREALRPEQIKRLRAITCQQLQALPTGSRVIAADKDVADLLRLSDEQKKRLEGSESLMDVLSEQQKKTWTGFLGPAFTVGEINPLGRMGTTLASANQPALLQFLANRVVESELKLSAEQKAKLAALTARWTEAYPTLMFRDRDGRKKIATLDQELTKAAREVLQPAQRKRMDQILLQQVRQDGDDVFFRQAEVVAVLTLTREQRETISKLWKERLVQIRQLFSTGDEPPEIFRKLDDYQKETTRRIEHVLSEQQRKRLRDMLGEPFTEHIFGPRPRMGRWESSPSYLMDRARLFLLSPVLHRALNLTDRQIEEMKELSDPRITLSGDSLAIGVLAKWDHQAIEKQLGAILTSEQLTRFKQLLLQQMDRLSRGRITNRISMQMLATMVEVAEGLSLTDEQKRMMQEGPALEDVLDAKQQAKWKKMLGEPFEGVLREVYPESKPAVLRLLSEPSVGSDLHLSDEQRKGLAQIESKYREETELPRFGSGIPMDRIRNDQTAAQTRAEQAATKLLDARQARRLQQLQLQQRAVHGRGALLSHPSVVAGLELSETQRKRIQLLQREYGNISYRIGMEFRSSLGTLSRELSAIRTAIDRIIEQKLQEVLTPAQKVTLKELLGKPFRGKLPLDRL